MKFLGRLVRSIDTTWSSSSITGSRFVRNRRTVAESNDSAIDVIEIRRDRDDGVASPTSSSVDITTTPLPHENANSMTTAALLDASRRVAAHGKKEATLNASSEIDAVVACLASSGSCFVRQSQGTLRPCRIALFLVICTVLAIYSFRPIRQTCVVLTLFDEKKFLPRLFGI